MAKFLFIYRESTVSRAQPSPEEMQALQAHAGDAQIQIAQVHQWATTD